MQNMMSNLMSNIMQRMEKPKRFLWIKTQQYFDIDTET